MNKDFFIYLMIRLVVEGKWESRWIKGEGIVNNSIYVYDFENEFIMMFFRKWIGKYRKYLFLFFVYIDDEEGMINFEYVEF